MPTGPANRFMPTLRRVVLAGTVSDRTDGQLLGAFVTDRDADAFAGLVRRHGPMVLGVCRRVTGDSTTADDAFQAVFLVLARRAAAIKPREQVGNWLYGVAYRTAIKARMVLARRRSREKQVEVMPEPSVSPPELWSDLQPLIDEELARLPDKHRFPIVLCDLEGRPQREVAKQLSLPLATLASRLAAARRSLARRLTSRGVTLSGGALAGLLTAHGTVAAVPTSLAYGLAQAAEAVAGGNVATSLVSPHAIQLSEGVIRMMFLTKLKMITVCALTMMTLTCGLGLGLVPAVAGEDRAQQPVPPAATGSPSANDPSGNPKTKQTAKVILVENATDANVDDATFLKRLILDLRGTQPTDVETWFFMADQDTNKRAKVLVWLTGDDALLAHLANKLGVAVDKIRLIRVVAANGGKPATVVLASVNAGPKNQQGMLYSLLRTPLSTASANRNANTLSRNLNTLTGDTVRVWQALNSTSREAPSTPWEVKAALDAINPSATAIPGDVGWITPYLDLSANLYTSDLLIDTSGKITTDAEFLKTVLLEARGTPPTSLEEKYFMEDKDPKKREKLIDTLLKDPAVAKKLGDEWKQKMLAGPTITTTLDTAYFTVRPLLTTYNGAFTWNGQGQLWMAPTNQSSGVANLATLDPRALNAVVAPQPTPQEKLVDELLSAKKTDPEMLEALTLATVGRLPTDAEKRLTLSLVAKAQDRKGAWLDVAKALTTTEEGAKRTVSGVNTAPKANEVVPVPPARP